MKKISMRSFLSWWYVRYEPSLATAIRYEGRREELLAPKKAMHMGRPTVANTRLSETNAPARARALASSYVVLLCPKRVGPAGGRDGLAIEEGAELETGRNWTQHIRIIYSVYNASPLVPGSRIKSSRGSENKTHQRNPRFRRRQQ
jgi:hypothetical protein